MRKEKTIRQIYDLENNLIGLEIVETLFPFEMDKFYPGWRDKNLIPTKRITKKT